MGIDEDIIICVCCNDPAIVIFDDKTALCRTHGVNYQTILDYIGQAFQIKVMELD